MAIRDEELDYKHHLAFYKRLTAANFRVAMWAIFLAQVIVRHGALIDRGVLVSPMGVLRFA